LAAMTAIVACRSGLYLFRAVLSSAQMPPSLRVRLGHFSRANPGHFWRALKRLRMTSARPLAIGLASVDSGQDVADG